MGLVRVRHLVVKGKSSYWQPTKAMRALGFKAEKLYGTQADIIASAEARNARWDAFRGVGPMEALPGTVTYLRERYSGKLLDGELIRPPSFEFKKLRPRTQKDYRYWLDAIERDFGDIPVTALTPRALKTYYHMTVEGRGNYAGYHMMITFRSFLSWCVSEDALDSNPGLKVVVSVPEARKIRWMPKETALMVKAAKEENRPSIALAVLLADWLAQRPFDVRTLLWDNYDGKNIIGMVQEKTRTPLPPIKLTIEIKKLLDAIPRGQSDYVIVSEGSGKPYSEINFQHVFAAIRDKAGIPKHLKFADFRRTGATEMTDSGSNDDQLRSITGHKDRNVVARYAIPTSATSDAAVAKRLRHRAKAGKKLAQADAASLKESG